VNGSGLGKLIGWALALSVAVGIHIGALIYWARQAPPESTLPDGPVGTLSMRLVQRT